MWVYVLYIHHSFTTRGKKCAAIGSDDIIMIAVLSGNVPSHACVWALGTSLWYYTRRPDPLPFNERVWLCHTIRVGDRAVGSHLLKWCEHNVPGPGGQSEGDEKCCGREGEEESRRDVASLWWPHWPWQLHPLAQNTQACEILCLTIIL